MIKLKLLKSTIFYLLISLNPLFWSCNDVINELSHPPNNESPTFLAINEETAVKLGVAAVNRLKYGDESTTTRASELTVKEICKYPNTSRATQRQCYIINYEEGGFAIVAPNSEILALNDNGVFSPEEYEPDKYFMDLALGYINNPSTINEPEPIPFDSTAVLEPAFIWHNDHRCGIQSVSSTPIPKFKLLNTAWSQWYPYNDQCPVVKNNKGEDVTAPVGCGPLAVAQIMVMHQKPTSYKGVTFDWNAMNKTTIYGWESASENVAYLCRQIGLVANASYKYNATSTTTNNIFNTLKHFGYNQVTLYNGYSEDIIITDVYKNKHPILIRAEGPEIITKTDQNGNTTTTTSTSRHMWVIDGAVQYQTEYIHTNLDLNTQCYTSISQTTYLHCNWGWGRFYENKDGYYLSKVFNPEYNSYNYTSNTNYNSGFSIIYNIY